MARCGMRKMMATVRFCYKFGVGVVSSEVEMALVISVVGRWWMAFVDMVISYAAWRLSVCLMLAR